MFKSDHDVNDRIADFFNNLDYALSSVFPIRFYKGFMMKIIKNEYISFCLLIPKSRNYITVRLLFFENFLSSRKPALKEANNWDKLCNSVREMLEMASVVAHFQIMDLKLRKFLSVKIHDLENGRNFKSYSIANYFNPFYNDKFNRGFGEFMNRNLRQLSYFSEKLHSEIISMM